MEEEYVSNIVLELQPRSRRGYRRLFGIRENKFFNRETFDTDDFKEIFLKEFNRKTVQRGDHVTCNDLIIAVKQIKRNSSTSCGNTEVEFRLKGIPFKHKKVENTGTLNNSFIDDKNCDVKLNTESTEQVYSCHCSECKKCLTNGDFYVKSGNWSRPILCLPCYELFFTHKCVRCTKSITFDDNSSRADGLSCIRYVEHNGLYWHSDCCVCVTCLHSLLGEKFYQDELYNQLFCLEHLPYDLQ